MLSRNESPQIHHLSDANEPFVDLQTPLIFSILPLLFWLIFWYYFWTFLHRLNSATASFFSFFYYYFLPWASDLYSFSAYSCCTSSLLTSAPALPIFWMPSKLWHINSTALVCVYVYEKFSSMIHSSILHPFHLFLFLLLLLPLSFPLTSVLIFAVWPSPAFRHISLASRGRKTWSGAFGWWVALELTVCPPVMFSPALCHWVGCCMASIELHYGNLSSCGSL